MKSLNNDLNQTSEMQRVEIRELTEELDQLKQATGAKLHEVMQALTLVKRPTPPATAATTSA